MLRVLDFKMSVLRQRLEHSSFLRESEEPTINYIHIYITMTTSLCVSRALNHIIEAIFDTSVETGLFCGSDAKIVKQADGYGCAKQPFRYVYRTIFFIILFRISV